MFKVQNSVVASAYYLIMGDTALFYDKLFQSKEKNAHIERYYLHMGHFCVILRVSYIE